MDVLGECWSLPDVTFAARWSRCLVRGPVGPLRRLAVADDQRAWTSRVTVASIAARAGEYLMLHAAGVSDTSGAVASLVAPSGTGKTTAAITLCRSGFGYVSDETVAISRDGGVLPFARPLGRIPAGGGPKIEKGPDELGLAYCPKRLHLGAVLLLERSSRVANAEVEAFSLLRGLAGIVEHTSALTQMAEPLAWAAANLERAGGVHHVRYAESAELVPVVEAALAAKPLNSGWVHHAPRSAPREPVQPGMIGRSDYVDAVSVDDQVLMLIGYRCFLLEGLAGVLWQALEQDIVYSDLSKTVVGLVGDHPYAETLTRQAYETLRDIGAIISGARTTRTGS